MNASIRRQLLTAALVCGILCVPHVWAQSETAAPTSQAAGDTALQPQKPSSLIAPAVDHLGQVVSQVQLEKWKGSSRDETDANLRSVERNLTSTLPNLVNAADAEPASLIRALPLLRNLNALCAVMIRVSVTAHTSAPGPQAEAIAGALTALQSASDSLAEHVQTVAAAQATQLASLTSMVSILTAKLNTPPPTPPPATAVAKPRPKKKAVPRAAPASKPSLQ